jgi:hypothetical protein
VAQVFSTLVVSGHPGHRMIGHAIRRRGCEMRAPILDQPLTPAADGHVEKVDRDHGNDRPIWTVDIVHGKVSVGDRDIGIDEADPIVGERRLRVAVDGLRLLTEVLHHCDPPLQKGTLRRHEGSIPLVYHTSAYDSPDCLALMDGIVDIYMPDFKFWSPEKARLYTKAPDYPEAARRAIREMHRQVGPLVTDEQGVALRGILLRHLVMPGGAAGTPEIMHWIAHELSPETYVNLMAQYRPACHATAKHYPEINRCITAQEFQHALDAFRDAGLGRLDHDSE